MMSKCFYNFRHETLTFQIVHISFVGLHIVASHLLFILNHISQPKFVGLVNFSESFSMFMLIILLPVHFLGNLEDDSSSLLGAYRVNSLFFIVFTFSFFYFFYFSANIAGDFLFFACLFASLLFISFIYPKKQVFIHCI